MPESLFAEPDQVVYGGEQGADDKARRRDPNQAVEKLAERQRTAAGRLEQIEIQAVKPGVEKAHGAVRKQRDCQRADRERDRKSNGCRASENPGVKPFHRSI